MPDSEIIKQTLDKSQTLIMGAEGGEGRAAGCFAGPRLAKRNLRVRRAKVADEKERSKS